MPPYDLPMNDPTLDRNIYTLHNPVKGNRYEFRYDTPKQVTIDRVWTRSEEREWSGEYTVNQAKSFWKSLVKEGYRMQNGTTS